MKERRGETCYTYMTYEIKLYCVNCKVNLTKTSRSTWSRDKTTCNNLHSFQVLINIIICSSSSSSSSSIIGTYALTSAVPRGGC